MRTTTTVPAEEPPSRSTIDRRHVLVTNDDGIESAGLLALAVAAADAGWHVTVVAPASDRSGSGAATGPLGSTEPRRVAVSGRAELSVHAIDAPPAVAVLAAHAEAFGARPLGVLCGVNHGINVGRLVLHSGTVGAALTAANLGLPAVAVSLEPSMEPDWNGAAKLAVDQLAALLADERPLACNLNVPAGWRGDETVVATLASSGRVTAAVADDRFTFDVVMRESATVEPGSDVALLAAGHAIARSGRAAGLADGRHERSVRSHDRSGCARARRRRAWARRRAERARRTSPRQARRSGLNPLATGTLRATC